MLHNTADEIAKALSSPSDIKNRPRYRTVEASYRTVETSYRTVEAYYRTVEASYRTVEVSYRTVEEHERVVRARPGMIHAPPLFSLKMCGRGGKEHRRRNAYCMATDYFTELLVMVY